MSELNVDKWAQIGLGQLEGVPEVTGVYRFLDASGRILYIGKSVRLRTRVRSYLRQNGGHSHQTGRLKSEAVAVEVLPTGSELAALLLEGRLIRQLLPPYNRAQTRYRHYPFLRLSIQEAYPRLHLTRTLAADGAEYYGPYHQGRLVAGVAELLTTGFGLRSCNDLAEIQRGCLLDQLGRCLAPCRSAAVAPLYGERVEKLRALLRGEPVDDLIGRYEAQMYAAAGREDFEQAARLRDRVRALRGFLLHQGYLREQVRLDAVAIQPGPPVHPGSVELFWVRRGRLLAQHCLGADLEGPALRQLLRQTIDTLHLDADEPQITFSVPQQDLDEAQIIGAWLYRYRRSAALLWLAELTPEQAVRQLVEQIRLCRTARPTVPG